MSWIMEFHDDFEAEFESMDEDVQDALLAAAKAVQMAGPKAGRPYVDTLGGSKHANMKERRAIILTAGAKQGMSQRLFYKRLVKKADARFDSHLKAIADARKRRKD
jgi:hypothetical protein